MRIVQGYRLRVHDISHLSREECEHLRAKMGIFAVSIKRMFDDPILVEGDCLIAHYTREEYARETLKHIQDYLKSGKMIDNVTVTLLTMKLSLDWDDIEEVGNARNAKGLDQVRMSKNASV